MVTRNKELKMSTTTHTAALTPEDELLARAKRRVDIKVGFAIHLLVFVLVNLALYAFNPWGGNGQPWSGSGHRWGGFFPLWGWGLGLAIHGVVTLLKLNGDGLRDRMLDAEVQRLRQRG